MFLSTIVAVSDVVVQGVARVMVLMAVMMLTAMMTMPIAITTMALFTHQCRRVLPPC
jgi:hypothetical protein